MQPSGLIFVVIIAIWAAYLIQHWVRRREYLATARSVDRFSEAMRVLEKRTVQSSSSSPRPKSYAVSPARPSRPEVVVKRAQPTVAEVSVKSSAAGASVAPRRRTKRRSWARDARVPRRSQAPVRLASRPMRLLAGTTGRRARALLFLVSLLLVLALSPLAALHLVYWWSAFAALGLLVLVFAWLRQAAKSARRARIADRVRRGRAEVVAASMPSTSGAASRRPSASVPSSMQASVRASTPAADCHDTAARSHPVDDADEEGFELDPAVPAYPVVAAADPGTPAEGGFPDDIAAGGWAPVPVPPPTYTLKAKAPERPQPEEADEPEESEEPEGPEQVFDNSPLPSGGADQPASRRHAAG